MTGLSRVTGGRLRPPPPPEEGACDRHEGSTPRRHPDHAGVRISLVVLFFEILLILAAVLITWFGVYTLYRLVTDES